MRPKGMLAATSDRAAGSSSRNAIILESKGPGATALTVTWSGASRRPRWRVSMTRAALEAE